MERSTVRRNLSDVERSQLIVFFQQNLKDGKLCHKKRREAAARWNVSPWTITRLAALQRKQQHLGVPIDLRKQCKGKKGRSVIELNKEMLMAVPLQRRTSQRSLAAALNVSRTKLRSWIKTKEIRNHSNAIKPSISELNQLRRLHYCVSHLQHNILTSKTTFKDMHHVVHIDEKWFFLTTAAEKYYLLPEEDDPHRTCQNKRFITKVMFMCAVCRPVFNEFGDVLFDGKIGLWPFVTTRKALKGSPMRLKGTCITTPMKVDRDVTRNFMIHKLLPAIKQKWPLLASGNIYIQQDNAKPHIHDDDPEFRAAASSDGFNIRIGPQPAQSPDLNVLDLGFFRSIQTLQHEAAPKTIDQLIAATANAFHELNAKTLNKVFLTLQGAMIEIMKVRGSNRYKIPHMGKDALERQGMLPTDLEVDDALVRTCVQYLQEAAATSGLQRLIETLEETAQPNASNHV